MTFSKFADYLDKLEQTSSRLDMTEILAEFFKDLDQNEVEPASYLMQGELVAKHQSLKFNLSTKLMQQVLAEVVHRLDEEKAKQATNLFQEKDLSDLKAQVQEKFKKLGDLGLVAQQILEKLNQQPQDLSLIQVYQKLVAIAQDEGEGSQDRKVNNTAKLLTQLTANSAKFAARIIIGNLRLGFSIMTMIDALSWVRYGDKSARKKIELAYQKRADIGQLAKGYLQAKSNEQAQQFLQTYQVEVGTPVLPALCQRLNTAHEIIAKMGQVIAEPKYDGLRAQVHINKAGLEAGKDVAGKGELQFYQVYTRNLDNISHMFPELEEAVKQLDCQSCILDAEAIAYDPKTNQLLPFQKTITRRRKYDVANKAEETPIRFYAFDLLAVDNQPLVERPLIERKAKLAEILANNSILQATEYIKTKDAGRLKDYHHKMLDEGLEGAVIKKIDAPYRAGRKGWRWVKIKESEGQKGKLNDTLDCVILGYYRGKGKRTKFGIGAFLAGVLKRTEKEIKIKTIAKIGTGLTDEQFEKLKKLADNLETPNQPDLYDVPKDLGPDVWLEPDLVVEIAADELTNSPLHSAGQALRFPRLVAFRADKDWEQATTMEELEQIEVS